MARVLKNHDVESLYPTVVEEYGYSSRNQANKNEYVDILHTRKKAKHGLLEDDFLNQFGVTNKDLNGGLKLPLNAYTGCLRAKFNALYDPLQGFSICTTGQCLIMQLIHDLMKVPTLEMVSANTDAVMYTIEEEHYPEAVEVLDKWQKKTRLKLEDDHIQKIIMRDVNNYCEILKVGDNDYDIHYKGGELTRGEHEFKWDKENKTFKYSYKPSLKSNSMSICSEALLKYLLFDIPIEDTINKCNDMIRFQIISHLGSTYEKCVQETPNGDVELQRNNRIYAGKKPMGSIMKVKADGRRDSLANCPTNPVVDNANELTIDDIDKEWYIDYAKQKAKDFLGIKRLDDYKKDELLKLAEKYNLNVEKKTKKVELIKLLKEKMKEEEKNMATKKVEEVKEEVVVSRETSDTKVLLLRKIAEFRKQVQEHEFVLDKIMDDKHGGNEYVSIGQFYNFVQQTCMKLGLDFSFEPIDEIRFERDAFKSSVGAARHVSEVQCMVTFTDIETGEFKTYSCMGAGSDTIDKGIGAAQTMAFRNWFKFNFTPKEKFDWDDEEVSTNEVSESTQPKVPTYVPPVAKEEIKKEVVATTQHESSDEEDIEKIAAMIMEIRTKTGDNEYAKAQVTAMQSGTLSSADIDALRVAIENKYYDVVGA